MTPRDGVSGLWSKRDGYVFEQLPIDGRKMRVLNRLYSLGISDVMFLFCTLPGVINNVFIAVYMET